MAKKKAPRVEAPENLLLSPSSAPSEEVRFENELRPQRFEDFVGQTKLKENLRVYVQAARARSGPLDHVLFFGPPGLGKTTLAHILAAELGVGLHVAHGPAIEHKGQLAALVTKLSARELKTRLATKSVSIARTKSPASSIASRTCSTRRSCPFRRGEREGSKPAVGSARATRSASVISSTVR
jgi:hypothetical protein